VAAVRALHPFIGCHGMPAFRFLPQRETLAVTDLAPRGQSFGLF